MPIGTSDGDRRGDLGARQHPARELDRHLGLERDAAAVPAHRAVRGVDRGLGAEQVVHRLDDEQVDAALEQPVGELLVRGAQVVEADLAERRELRARPHRARDPPRRAPASRNSSATSRAIVALARRELERPVRDAVLGEHDREAAERVGLDDVDADVEERAVQLLDDVGPRRAEHLVAALERRAAEVVGAQLGELEVRARSPRRRRRRPRSSAARYGRVVGTHPQRLVHATAPLRAQATGAPAGSISRCASTPAPVTTARPGCTSVDGCARTIASIELNGDGRRGAGRRSASRAPRRGAGGELDELLISVERDLWVLMAEVATAPDNRRKLVAGKSLVTDEMVTRLERAIDGLADRTELPKEFVVPGDDHGGGRPRRRPHRGAARRAAVRSAGVPTARWSPPYLNRLSDLLWAAARWQEGDAHRTTKGVEKECAMTHSVRIAGATELAEVCGRRDARRASTTRGCSSPRGCPATFSGVDDPARSSTPTWAERAGLRGVGRASRSCCARSTRRRSCSSASATRRTPTPRCGVVPARLRSARRAARTRSRSCSRCPRRSRPTRWRRAVVEGALLAVAPIASSKTGRRAASRRASSCSCPSRSSGLSDEDRAPSWPRARTAARSSPVRCAGRATSSTGPPPS